MRKPQIPLNKGVQHGVLSQALPSPGESGHGSAMDASDKRARGAFVSGAGATLVSTVATQAFPNAPTFIWQALFAVGLLLMAYGAISAGVHHWRQRRGPTRTAAPLSEKYIVGGRAEDEPGVTIGPMSAAEALAHFAPSGRDYVPIEDAGRWLYENASPKIRKALKDGVPSPFDSIAEHGAAFFRTQWTEGRCALYGRWEPGLPMELIDPKEGDFSAFETAFGSPRRKPLDLSVLRKDLRPVLDYYERDEPAPSRHHVMVKRDTPLQEALMFIVTGRWGLNPMTEGGGLLQGVSDALATFRQHASDGAITVWGKADQYGVWQVIEPKYWVTHYVDLLGILGLQARAKAYNALSAEPLFQELMVSRAEIESEWHAR